jgi:transcriptional regulator GlxA family with amidase domain
VRVALLLYDGCFGAEAFGFSDLLVIANRAIGRSGDRLRAGMYSAGGGVITTAGGTRIETRRLSQQPDLLVIPGFDLHPDDDLDKRLGRWEPTIERIESASQRGTAMASICVGAFLLGAADALNERRCTTAWLYAEQLARRFPRASVDRNEMLVADGQVTTTAAFTAAYDLALDVIKRTLGPAMAQVVGRVTLTHTRSRQSPYVDPRLDSVGDNGLVQEVKVWMTAHLSDPYDLRLLSRTFNVSPRTLLRRFQGEARQSPLSYLQDLRLAEARSRLSTTHEPVSAVARAVGYSDVATFRRLFRSRIGMTPSDYRGQFLVSH